jgi:hypothetical protein
MIGFTRSLCPVLSSEWHEKVLAQNLNKMHGTAANAELVESCLDAIPLLLADVWVRVLCTRKLYCPTCLDAVHLLPHLRLKGGFAHEVFVNCGSIMIYDVPTDEAQRVLSFPVILEIA